MTARDDAADLLIHYMRLAFESAGREWDSDYSAELRDLVDRIVDAAVDEALAAVAEAPPEVAS
jgi:hypothetical protein